MTEVPIIGQNPRLFCLSPSPRYSFFRVVLADHLPPRRLTIPSIPPQPLCTVTSLVSRQLLLSSRTSNLRAPLRLRREVNHVRAECGDRPRRDGCTVDPQPVAPHRHGLHEDRDEHGWNARGLAHGLDQRAGGLDPDDREAIRVAMRGQRRRLVEAHRVRPGLQAGVGHPREDSKGLPSRETARSDRSRVSMFCRITDLVVPSVFAA